MAMSSAQKMQRLRERVRNDRVLLTVELDRAPVAELLRRIDPTADDTSENLSRVVERYLHASLIEGKTNVAG